MFIIILNTIHSVLSPYPLVNFPTEIYITEHSKTYINRHMLRKIL